MLLISATLALDQCTKYFLTFNGSTIGVSHYTLEQTVLGNSRCHNLVRLISYRAALLLFSSTVLQVIEQDVSILIKRPQGYQNSDFHSNTAILPD